MDPPQNSAKVSEDENVQNALPRSTEKGGLSHMAVRLPAERLQTLSKSEALQSKWVALVSPDNLQTIICQAQEGQESWPRNVDLCEIFGRRGERFRLYPELMSLSTRPLHMQCVNVCTNLQHEIHTVRATEKVNSHPQLLRSVML